jgi:hypothetical protein
MALLVSVGAACITGPGAIPQDATPQATQRIRPTASAVPMPTRTQIPPRLPEPFESRYMKPLDSAHTYVEDTCEYLGRKWDPAAAAPGTIVLIVMLHSINQGKPEGIDAVSEVVFARMMDDLHEQHFEAIDLDQLAGFLENNDWIPPRSVVLIQDGRRYPENFERHFRRFQDKWGWPVVNAWDHQGETTDPLWEDYASLANDGLVDFQVYGPTFDPESRPRPDDYIELHLETPLSTLEERLGVTPIGVVWPSGFSESSVAIARQLGYRLGFTFNARGPVMYNWIPLSGEPDKFRPAYKPEIAIGDPLMTLPRYWPYQVHDAIDEVRIAGKEAEDYALLNKAVEMAYYEIACQEEYGPIPSD